FGWLNTRRAAAFWIICSGFTTQAGRPVRRALQKSRREFTKVCTSSWVAYWVRYGLILRMLNSAKRQDLETEAMWSVKVSLSSIMTPRCLAVLDGTRDKESILMLMWWMACLAGKTISSVLARFSWRWWFFIHVDISARQSEICAETVVSSGGKDRNSCIIGITVIGKPMRADDRAQRGGVNGKEKWYHHRALGHPSGEAVRYRQLTLPRHVERAPSEVGFKPGVRIDSMDRRMRWLTVSNAAKSSRTRAED